MRANGTFEVTLTPQPRTEGIGDPLVDRMSVEKRFEGDLRATARGEMLIARTATEGSAGYVLIERVTGVLEERAGAFTLQHHGLMDRGDGRLTIDVVPGSGTDGLAGLSGGMTIEAVDGVHRYSLDYELPGS